MLKLAIHMAGRGNTYILDEPPTACTSPMSTSGSGMPCVMQSAIRTPASLSSSFHSLWSFEDATARQLA